MLKWLSEHKAFHTIHRSYRQPAAVVTSRYVGLRLAGRPLGWRTWYFRRYWLWTNTWSVPKWYSYVCLQNYRQKSIAHAGVVTSDRIIRFSFVTSPCMTFLFANTYYNFFRLFRIFFHIFCFFVMFASFTKICIIFKILISMTLYNQNALK